VDNRFQSLPFKCNLQRYTVGQSLYDELTGLQSGKVEDVHSWLENVPEGFHL
jgi:hypothetical protein